jgi:hypothetical protein
LLTAELKLGTVAALFATVPRESPPETGQALIASPVFFLPAGDGPIATISHERLLRLAKRFLRIGNQPHSELSPDQADS